MTLREDVMRMVYGHEPGGLSTRQVLDNIAGILEDTGAPAYIRVAKDLRGEWEPITSGDVTPA